MKMHFENEMNSNSQSTTQTTVAAAAAATPTTTTAGTNTTTSGPSRTDSGVIIIDNTTTLNHSDSGKNINNNSCDGGHIANEFDKTNNGATKSATAAAQSERKLKLEGGYINQKNSNNPSHTNINIENTVNITRSSCGGGIENGDFGESNDTRRQWSPNFIRTNNKPASQNCSPTISMRSTSISIVSIDENAIDSSVIDSDSDIEIDGEGMHNGYMVKKLGQQTTYSPDSPNLPYINKGLRVVSQKISTPDGASVHSAAENILNGDLGASGPLSATTPQIGAIALTNSTDVTFGDKHIYGGPVTIQQFLIDKQEKWKPIGVDNPVCDLSDESAADTALKSDPPPSDTDQPYKFIFNRKAVIITGTIIVLTILIGILIVASSSIFKTSIQKSKLLGDGDDSRKNIPINSTIDTDDDDDFGNGTLRIVDRADWQARPPKDELDKLKLPVHRVIISHTASEGCTEKAICSFRMRVIQDFHMDSFGWDDIGYNFVIGGDGRVYVGRGWNNQGAHTKGYNTDSVGVSFIGTFMQAQPTPKQIEAAQLLCEEGVRLKKLVPDYRLYGARQMGGTESPGDALYKIIKTWPHWTADIL